VIIQAVDFFFNFSICIVESNEMYAPLNHIEPVVSQQEPSVILLGHIDEIHCVSTEQIPCKKRSPKPK